MSLRKPSFPRCTSLLGYTGECKDIRQCPPLSQLTRRQLKPFACNRGLVSTGLFCCPPLDRTNDDSTSTDRNQMILSVTNVASNKSSVAFIEKSAAAILDTVQLIPPSDVKRPIKPHPSKGNAKDRHKTQSKKKAPIKSESIKLESHKQPAHTVSGGPSSDSMSSNQSTVISLTSATLIVNDTTRTKTLTGHYSPPNRYFEQSKAVWSTAHGSDTKPSAVTSGWNQSSDHDKLPKSTSNN